MATRGKSARKRKADSDEKEKLDDAKKEKLEDKDEETGLRVVIEHCKSWRVYGRNADVVREALADSHPQLKVTINPHKPRRNSFEITLMDGERADVLWSGIKKGPPRKLKFPEPAEVVTALKQALEKE